jgi:hypothetical protein
MRLGTILRRHSQQLALLIGNGINRHSNAAAVNSWDDLLVDIARDCIPGVRSVPPGTALTEFYDVVELKSLASIGDLQAEFCRSMADWRPFPHHRRIMRWAVANRVPVLTTNFDDVLSQAAGCGFQFPRNPKFTAFYPWGCHFALDLVLDPCADFGIWHVNGMARYKTSIRLGLSHYMGSVQRARGWLHGRGDDHLFRSKNRRDWLGARTWVHVVFNKPLLIFGLALGENEVFLRWLLIERAKYFRAFPDRAHEAWYVYVDDRRDERQAGKHFFLELIGVRCIEVGDYAELYENDAWSAA